MTAGQMNQPLTLQSPQRLPDGGGGFETTWQDVADIFASIGSAEVEEIPERGGKVTRKRCRLTVHYREGLAPGLRFRGGDIAYDILSLRDPDGRRVYLEIIAEESQAEA